MRHRLSTSGPGPLGGHDDTKGAEAKLRKFLKQGSEGGGVGDAPRAPYGLRPFRAGL